MTDKMTYKRASELLAMIEVDEPDAFIVHSWWGSFAKDYKEALQMAIEAIEQEPILDKIRDEIETEKNAGCHTQYAGGLDFALSIIDKYKEESEDKE